jgi:enamine deaminase RidA (YjgF/YER057c/UK114 family)
VIRWVRRGDVSKSFSPPSKDWGGKLSDVIRTRILLIRIEDWERVATVHGEFFGSIRPANTIMQVVRFIDPDWLVEVEADAVVED